MPCLRSSSSTSGRLRSAGASTTTASPGRSRTWCGAGRVRACRGLQLQPDVSLPAARRRWPPGCLIDPDHGAGAVQGVRGRRSSRPARCIPSTGPRRANVAAWHLPPGLQVATWTVDDASRAGSSTDGRQLPHHNRPGAAKLLRAVAGRRTSEVRPERRVEGEHRGRPGLPALGLSARGDIDAAGARYRQSAPSCSTPPMGPPRHISAGSCCRRKGHRCSCRVISAARASCSRWSHVAARLVEIGRFVGGATVGQVRHRRASASPCRPAGTVPTPMSGPAPSGSVAGRRTASSRVRRPRPAAT